MTRSQSTPASSQIVWLEGRVAEMELELASKEEYIARMEYNNEALRKEVAALKQRLTPAQQWQD